MEVNKFDKSNFQRNFIFRFFVFLAIVLTTIGGAFATSVTVSNFDDLQSNISVGTADTILVDSDISFSVLDISRAGITLKADGSVTLTGLIEVSANDVTIDGFTLIGDSSSDSAIDVMGIDNLTINGNILEGYRGVRFDVGSGTDSKIQITNNTFNTDYGVVQTENVLDLLIKDNTFNTQINSIGLGVGVTLNSEVSNIDELFINNEFNSEFFAIRDRRHDTNNPISYNNEQQILLLNFSSEPTIQYVIDFADDYTTIILGEGTFNEIITINKPLTIIGASRENTIIQGAAGDVNEVLINSNDITLSNLTIRGEAGATAANTAIIGLSGAENVELINLNVEGPTVGSEKTGINLFDSDNVLIEDVSITNTGKNGINVRSRDVTVKNVVIDNAAIGRTGFGAIAVYGTDASGANPLATVNFEGTIELKNSPNGLIFVASDDEITITSNADFVFDNISIYKLTDFGSTKNIIFNSGNLDLFAQNELDLNYKVGFYFTDFAVYDDNINSVNITGQLLKNPSFSLFPFIPYLVDLDNSLYYVGEDLNLELEGGRFEALVTDINSNFGVISESVIHELSEFRFAVQIAVNAANANSFTIDMLQDVADNLTALGLTSLTVNGFDATVLATDAQAGVAVINTLDAGRITALINDVHSNAQYNSFEELSLLLNDLVEFRIVVEDAVEAANNGSFTTQYLVDVNTTLTNLISKTVNGQEVTLASLNEGSAIIDRLNALEPGRFNALVNDLEDNGDYSSFTQMSITLYQLLQFREAVEIAVNAANANSFTIDMLQDVADNLTALGLTSLTVNG
ncbi:MAG: right-handed parallel beta-helix repeat-containing protein, partial [Nanoarchaeota archaeon]|nr:right-handed parallel beta-helix repeat-containing protein [Nanoarchaeota archaeon]